MSFRSPLRLRTLVVTATLAFAATLGALLLVLLMRRPPSPSCPACRRDTTSQSSPLYPAPTAGSAAVERSETTARAGRRRHLRAAPPSSAARPQHVQDAAAINIPHIARRLFVALVLLAALTLVGVGVLPAHLHVQAALLVGGAAALALAWYPRRLSSITRDTRLAPPSPDHLRRPQSSVLAFNFQLSTFNALLTLILLAAFTLRVVRLNDAVRWYVDEFLFADTVAALQDDPLIPLLQPQVGLSSIVWTFPYLQTHTVAMTGGDLFGLRLLSAFIGTLTVAAVAALARALSTRPTALAAALLLAVYPPHIHFSRLGLYNIADPLFGVLALTALAWALRQPAARRSPRTRWLWTLGGVLLALSHYWYEGGRVLYTVLVVVWLSSVALVMLSRRRLPLALVRGAAWAALAFVLMALPLYATWESMGGRMQTRTEQIGGLRLHNLRSLDRLPDYWRDQFVPAAEHLYLLYDQSLWHYGGTTPLLFGAMLVLVVVGAAALVLRPRRHAAALLLAWVLLTVAGSSLLDYVRFTARFVVVFPAFALLAAWGLVALVRLAAAVRVPPRLAWAAAALALLLLGYSHGHYYFAVHLPFYNVQLRANYRDYIDIFYRARDLCARAGDCRASDDADQPGGTRIHVITNDGVWQPHYAVLARYLDFDVPIEVVSSDGLSDYWFMQTYGTLAHHAFFVEPDNPETVERLRRWFYLPTPERSPYNVPADRQYLLYLTRETGAPPPNMIDDITPGEATAP